MEDDRKEKRDLVKLENSEGGKKWVTSSKCAQGHFPNCVLSTISVLLELWVSMEKDLFVGFYQWFSVCYVLWAFTDSSEWCFLFSSNPFFFLFYTPLDPSMTIFVSIIIKPSLLSSLSFCFFFIHVMPEKKKKEIDMSSLIGRTRQHPQLRFITLQGLDVVIWQCDKRSTQEHWSVTLHLSV